MGTESWLFLVSILCLLVALFAVFMVVKLGQNNYGNGYAKGFQDGEEVKYHEVYNKRLIRQAKRATAREKQDEPTDPEGPAQRVQGSTEPGDCLGSSGESNLFYTDAVSGPGAEPSHE